MINKKLLRSLEYVVVLFLFTGSVCLADPLQYGDPYRSNVTQFNKLYEMREAAVKGIEEICLVWDPTIEQNMRDAFDEFIKCSQSTADRARYSGSIGSFDAHGQEQQETKIFCRFVSTFKSCVRTFLRNMVVCEGDIPMDDLLILYQEVESIICVDDGEKLAEALKEINKINRRCQEEIHAELTSCIDDFKYAYKTKNQTYDDCRMFPCMKKSFNVCGGTKKAVNEILDDFMALKERRGECSYNSSKPVLSTSPVLSAAPLLITLIASYFMHRETHL